MMTDAEIEELEKLHAEATKGPYEWAKDDALRAPDGTIMMDGHEGDESARKDGNFIQAAYAKIPALLAEVKRLRALVKEED